MDIENIKDIFKNYLLAEKTQYALLLNGKWGSGKTFFWKNTLKPLAEESNKKGIYISLNGLSSKSDLERIFFLKTLPFNQEIKNKNIKQFLNVSGNVVEAIYKKFAKGQKLSDLIIGVHPMTNLPDLVVCLDDLERAKMNISEILGFVNNYTEHYGAKFLICADESEIKNSNYNNIKEKTIRHTFIYKPNLDSAFTSFKYSYSKDNSELNNFYRKYKKELLNEFKIHNVHNLRTFDYFFQAIKELYPIIKKEPEDVIKKIIFFTSLIVIEFKTGKLISSQPKDYKGLDKLNSFDLIFDEDMSINLYSLDEKSEDENDNHPYNKEFKKKYLTQTNFSQYRFLSPIFEFVLTGYLEPDKLTSILESDKRMGEKEENVVFRELMGYNFRDLDNNRFSELIEKALTFVEEGKYSFYDLVSIHNNFNYFIDNKLVSITKEQLLEKLNSSLDIVKEKKEINPSQMDSLMFFINERSEDEKAFIKIVKGCHDDIENKGKIEKAKEIYELMKGDDDDELDRFYKSYNYNNELFKFLNTMIFFDVIKTKMSNKNLKNFNLILKKRYDSFFHKSYTEDLTFFEELSEKINHLLIHESEGIGQPKKFLIESIKKTILEIIEKIKKYNKPEVG